MSSNKTLRYGTFLSYIFRTHRINVNVDPVCAVNSFIDILITHSCNCKLDDKGNWVRMLVKQSLANQALTVPPVAPQSFDALRSPHEAYPTLLAPSSAHTVCLLEAINGMSLQVDA
ncbi:hypothetical protein Goshw_004736 [Gossypium schwendimanii]|uniref:Uncharacterized protein n=1 Tax=Gossypium schwendimanii TaxID=34291 RepID=A0A7J9M9R4_GOSSC|nr:hypothetical protein [Gossypium schwendimanii]